MYKYLRQWPANRENGWSHELNGVCNDGKFWYFTQNGKPGNHKKYEIGVVWKFPVGHRIGNKVTIPRPEKEILNYDFSLRKDGIKYHCGDIDCCNGFLFVPITGDGDPYIQVFTTKDLIPITKQVIKRPDGRFFDSLAWCAINPNDKCLYTSDRHISANFNNKTRSPFVVYNIDFDKIRNRKTNFLTYKTFIVPLNGNGAELSYDYIQGGCFDNANHLHTTNGNCTGVTKKYCKDGIGGIFMFDVPQLNNNGYSVRRMVYSRQRVKNGFRYQFDGLGDEPEGITFWDLNGGEAPSIKGVLHAIMLNNLGPDSDDFYFKHYDKI